MSKIFILSPANCSGRRAKMVLQPKSSFEAARQLHGRGLALGNLFTFLSGLYFRGKFAYASAFADPPPGCPGIMVITPCRGLLPPETLIGARHLHRFAESDLGKDIAAYTRPFYRDARRLAARLTEETRIILLGSIATGKYVNILLDAFGTRLHFPREFVGRGDMSRGALLLRCAYDSQELDYVPVEGAVVHGKKPPKLTPRRYPRLFPAEDKEPT
jgi:hypothetical protein